MTSKERATQMRNYNNLTIGVKTEFMKERSDNYIFWSDSVWFLTILEGIVDQKALLSNYTGGNSLSDGALSNYTGGNSLLDGALI